MTSTEFRHVYGTSPAGVRARGFRLADGRVSADGTGYYPAREGGGYSKTLIIVRKCAQFEVGCPAYHGTVAIWPR